MQLYQPDDKTVENFLTNSGPDHAQRTFEFILSQDDHWLETTHDYIQWCFPLTEPSQAVFGTPYVTEEFFENSSVKSEIQKSLILAFARMLNFYGLAYSENQETIVPSADFEKKAQWYCPANHNFLRLTRIMKSLYLCDLDDLAKMLCRCLLKLPEAKIKAGPTTLKHWKDAAHIN